MTNSVNEALVARRRQELEERLASLRANVRKQVGFLPKNSAWLVAILGLAAGVALAWRFNKTRRT